MWAVVGAPLDSAGAVGAEAAAPAALRAAGIVETLGAVDAGDIEARIHDTTRDPGSGVIGLADHAVAAHELGARTAATLEAGLTPLVLGGDCSVLLGIYRGLALVGRGAGLWLVDGHADFYDGHGSPSGEAADMELSALTGHGPPELAGGGPVLDPARVIVLGHRPPGLSPGVDEELARLPAEIVTLDATSIARGGATEAGRWAERRLSAAGDAWLHLDLDVLDQGTFPAVSYPQPYGLDWEMLAALVAPLIGSSALAGASIADLNPGLDPDGRHTRDVVQRVGPLLAARG